MKTTVFTKHHIANGAKMAEFAGYITNRYFVICYHLVLGVF